MRREPHVGLEAGPGANGQMIISYVWPGSLAFSAGARIGDTLLEIDGVQVDEQVWSRRGDTGASVRIARATQTGPVVEYAQIRSISGLYATILGIISFIFAATSFLIAWRTSDSNAATVASILLLVGAIAFAAGVASSQRAWWAQSIAVGSHQWAAALFFIFFAVFPAAERGRLPNPRPLWYGVAAGAAVFSVLNVLISFPLLHLPITVFQVSKPLRLVFLAAGFIGGLAYLVDSYLGTPSSVVKEQLRIMSVGITQAILPFLLFAVGPAVIGSSWTTGPELAAPFLVLVPLSFAYAIMRHRLMGIRRLVHRGVAYALITAVIVVAYFAILAFLGIVAGPEVSGNVAVQLVVIVVLSASLLLMSAVRRLAFAVVDRVLYREYVDHADLARRVSLAAAPVEHLDELAVTALDTIARELRLSFTVFLVVSRGAVSVKAMVGEVSPKFFEMVASNGSQSPSERVSSVVLDSGPYPRDALVVKVPSADAQTWMLCLGPKVNEEPFLKEDRNLAESLANSIATIVEKLELLQVLETKTLELRELNRRLVRTQELERTRIASYLHDEVLRDISDLVWHYGDSNGGAGLRQDLTHIAEKIRNFTANLHPAVLQDLGLVRALEWLASEASARYEFPVSYDTGNVWRDDRLGPEVELALCRIAQEALTNCGRHGKPTRAWLRLSRSEEYVTLAVDDNGTGFVPDPSFQPNSRLGLISMRERAEQVGGDFEIMPRPGGGTRVVATLPIAHDNVPSEGPEEQRIT